MWFEVIEAVKDRMEDFNYFKDNKIPIDGGIDVNQTSETFVEILRDTETGEFFHGADHGTVNIFIQPWCRVESPDPMEGYRAVAALENQIMSALEDIQKNPDSFSGMAYKFKLNTMAGDGDEFRPTVGSRLRISVEWKKTLSK